MGNKISAVKKQEEQVVEVERELFKVTNDVVEKMTLGEIANRLDKKTSDLIFAAICDKEASLLDALVDCESPIEMMLSIAISEADIYHTAEFLGVDILNYEKQAEIKVENETYRVDFLIETCHARAGIVQPFIIECDGHEFHEKTKDQVVKNNIRTRNLIKSGYIVINFSGSEIYESPFKCVREVKDIILYWYRPKIKD